MARNPKIVVKRRGGLVVLALSALALLLAPAEASAQITPLPTPNDYCDWKSAPNAKFTLPYEGWSYLNVNVVGAGTIDARMLHPTLATECVRKPYPGRFEAQAVCEWHCQHDHVAPYPWTVELVASGTNAGNLLGWRGTNCVPRTNAARSSCVVQMPAPGQTTTATATFGDAPDPLPPTPPSASPSSVGSYALTLSWTPSQDDWLAGYDLYTNGTLAARVGPQAMSARLENLRCQTTYSLEVAAFDAQNEARSAPVSATTGACVGSADTKPPNTVFHVRPPRTTKSRIAYFHWGATEPSRFRCKLDRRPWVKCRRSDPYVVSMGKKYRRLARGYHTFRVRAIDKAGNRDRTPAVWRWRIR